MSDYPCRGRLYWVTIPSEPTRKRRPGLVVSVDSRNRLAADVMVVPASTVLRPAPTHVRLRRGQGGTRRSSVLKCEQVTTLPKSQLGSRPLGGPLSPRLMLEVEKAILRAIGVPLPS